ALHGVALQRIHRRGHREESLAGAGGADAERDVAASHLLQVLRLARRARGELLAARNGERGPLRFLRARARVRDLDQAELDVLDREVAACCVVETPQRLRRLGGLLARAGDGEALATARDRDIERRLD